jgi:tetratricopeptide (TPR) repeat protein
VRLSRILLESGKTSEALDLVENGVELYPTDPSLSNHIGLLLTMLRRPREALPYLERAIALDPEYAEAHNNLGGAYSMLGDWESAANEFRRAVEIWPEYPTAGANLSNALRRARSTSEATDRSRELPVPPR